MRLPIGQENLSYIIAASKLETNLMKNFFGFFYLSWSRMLSPDLNFPSLKKEG